MSKVTQSISPDGRYRIETSYTLNFDVYHDGGFAFDCDVNGVPTLKSDASRANYEKCVNGEFKHIIPYVQKHERQFKLCNCGSGQDRRELHDARGYFCSFVCDDCETIQRTKFRSEIFENSSYQADDLGDEDY
jgi:hypothetical protein